MEIPELQSQKCKIPKLFALAFANCMVDFARVKAFSGEIIAVNTEIRRYEHEKVFRICTGFGTVCFPSGRLRLYRECVCDYRADHRTHFRSYHRADNGTNHRADYRTHHRAYHGAHCCAGYRLHGVYRYHG